MLKVNFENLKKEGFNFSSIGEIIEQLKSNAEFLESHNKNYTEKQYFLIRDCLAILRNIQNKETRKRKKINISELNQLGGYYAFYRGEVEGVKGYFYKMEKKLSETDKDFILSYKNTRLFYSRAQYAPEQISNLVFVGDKCFCNK